MEPASWFTTFVYKPVYVFQTMRIAIPWKISTRISITHPVVISFFQALRTSAPPFPTANLKIGAAGFCWGGKHTMLLAQDSPSSRVHRHDESQTNSGTLEPLIDCAFTAHPSYLGIPTDIEEISIPISVAVGDEDVQMKLPQIQQMKEILEAKKEGGHEVVVFPGAKHGFAVRNHPDDKREMECAEKAEVQAIEWFTRWFA
jgi:dienelactone hydrolase